eukprot:9214076-Pyramimonas_sp.AAC.1
MRAHPSAPSQHSSPSPHAPSHRRGSFGKPAQSPQSSSAAAGRERTPCIALLWRPPSGGILRR